MERRRIPVTKYRTEIEEKTTAVRKSVPETKQVRDVYVEMVSHVETRKEKYQVHIPEWHTVMQRVTVEVPTQELRTTTRKVCRKVQVEELQYVTRDNGHWEEDSENPCCKVWKPELVSVPVPVVICRDEIVEEPVEYYATVYHPETRLVPVKICNPIVQEREREVQVTVCEPRKREAIRSISTFRTVVVPETKRCSIQVPYTDYEEVEVPVCRQVAKRVCCSCEGEILKQ
jgi:hypothetical protein